MNRIACLFCCFVSTAMFAQESAEAPASGKKSLFETIAGGGPLMIILGLVLLLAIFLIIWCSLQTARGRFIPDSLVREVSERLRARDVPGAQEVLSGSNSVLSRSLSLALNKARPNHADANKDKVETLLVENLEAEESASGQSIQYLNVIATVSPMLGLFGTVIGMISAFDTISLGGMGKPELLAGDIGTALVTTAGGLAVGIPAMIAYYILKNRLNTRMVQTMQTASSLVDDLAGDERATPAESHFAHEHV